MSVLLPIDHVRRDVAEIREDMAVLVDLVGRIVGAIERMNGLPAGGEGAHLPTSNEGDA